MRVNLSTTATAMKFCGKNSLLNNSNAVNFGANKKIQVSEEKAKEIGDSLSTSTSGHRAVYGGENFNPGIVELITLGFAEYVNKRRKEGNNPNVIIGGDTRVATAESLPVVRNVLAGQGVDVQTIPYPVPTPLLAMAARDNNVTAAVLMTASHNPWSDGGYNLVTANGAIAPASVTKEVAKYMSQIASVGVYSEKDKKGKITEIEPYDGYKRQIEDYHMIDWDRIRSSGIKVYYDALRGTGKNTFPRLLNDYGVPFVEVVGQATEGPNPVEKNLSALRKAVCETENPFALGLTNDGDADRFGIIDEKGKFITPNDVLLLVGYHLVHNRDKQGAIIRSQATSRQLDRFAQNNDFETIETPVGFKYIAEEIMDMRKRDKDILVAGEESGGLTVSGHIPEKDGIIALELIMDLVAAEGKPLSEILEKVKSSLGVHYSSALISRKMLDNSEKEAVMRKIASLYNEVKDDGKIDIFGSQYKVDREKTLAQRETMESFREGGDGYNFILEDGSSLLFRKSGTEPLVKSYIEAQGDTKEEAQKKSCDLQKIVSEILDEK